ncbi:hypothetical protein GDO86_009569 [Hymenochirus boettgeri]|uniref:Phospholipid/glycerol acyltransferase domain-containing protein n=1 Tax=Hymenochirus boettgeri TaxID=247094 RepID=A0A8T2JL31_9PIPI|nr:hypothetical protein GDO86_009569 [Hymenochirus boettgeri]
MVSWKGIYFVLALFLGSFFGSIFMLGPFIPLMFLSPSWYRWITDRIVATWLTLPVALLELVFGAKVVITGDGFIPGERSVIIMNHRTRLDWMFLWNCLLRYSYLRLEKICLKSSLKVIPGFDIQSELSYISAVNQVPYYHKLLCCEHFCCSWNDNLVLIWYVGNSLSQCCFIVITEHA